MIQRLAESKAVFLLILATAFILSSCASNSGETSSAFRDGTHRIARRNAGEMYDPLEKINRGIFAFNKAVDAVIIHPIVKGYRAVIPRPARRGIQNFLQNLENPVVFANQLLQGDVDGAGDVVVRTAVNTLIGLGGVFDVAAYEGIEYEQEDFGQTLGVWGIGHGPYIVLPVFGPSSLRDYTGYAVDSIANPVRWYSFNTDREWLYYGEVGAEYLVLRESLMDMLLDLQESSIDYYAAVRSVYAQRREALVNDSNGAIDIPDYDEDF